MTIFKQLIEEQQKKAFNNEMNKEFKDLFTKKEFLTIPFDTLENAKRIDLSYTNNKNNN